MIHVTNNLEKPNDLQTSPSQMTNNIDHTHTDESVTTKNKGIEIFYTRLIHYNTLRHTISIDFITIFFLIKCVLKGIQTQSKATQQMELSLLRQTDA